MEISKFLHNPKTLELREDFLNSVKQRQENIQSYVQKLIDTNECDVETLNLLFNDVHKLKGAGGTYGFYEISSVYFQSLFTIRPAYNDKKMIDTDKLIELKTLFSAFHDFYPLLLQYFLNLKNLNPETENKTLFFASTNRDKLFTELEFSSIYQKYLFLSSMNVEESLYALSISKPDIIVVEADISGDNPLLIIKKAISMPTCKKLFVIGDHLTNKEKYIQAGASDLIIFNVKNKQNDLQKILSEL